MSQWFVFREHGKQYGPYSDRELKNLVLNGRLHPDDIVQRTDSHISTKAKAIKNLFPDDEILDAVEAKSEFSWEDPKYQPKQMWHNLSKASQIAIISGTAFFGLMFVCCGGMTFIGVLADGPSASNNNRPIARINAIHLCDDYNRNEIRADEDYKGQIIDVVGRVKSIDKAMFGDMTVTLSGDNGKFGFFGVRCVFSGSQKKSLVDILAGNLVVVRGKCEGSFLGNVRLKNCQLVN